MGIRDCQRTCCQQQNHSFHVNFLLPFQDSMSVIGKTAGLGCVIATALVSGVVLLRKASISIADANSETPANTSPPRKLPVRWLIAPIVYGPTKLPRLPTELIRAIPAAAENPVKNSLGSAQKGAYRQFIPAATKHQSAT